MTTLTCGHPVPDDSWPGPDGRRVFCPTCQQVRLDVAPTSPDLPLPNDAFDGETVIASIWLNDDADFEPLFAMLLTLAKEPPFYTLREITWKDGWVTASEEKHPNIVPATEAYVQNGGDY